MTFKDHFSGHADAYASFRPTYPPALFDALADAAPERALAWDVATGSGQAAILVADRFERVHASDASREQIEHATAHPRVGYHVEPAEQSSLADGSVDLVTIAQALHWFDLARFWPEVVRVARPGAVVATWSYALMRVESPGVDAIVDDLYRNVVGSYWPPERRHVENGYRDLPFPFEPVELGTFEMRAAWTLDELVGYLGTWSSVARHRKATGLDPLADVRSALASTWGAPDTRHVVTWPLSLRVGRVAR